MGYSLAVRELLTVGEVELLVFASVPLSRDGPVAGAAVSQEEGAFVCLREVGTVVAKFLEPLQFSLALALVCCAAAL